MSLSTEEHRQAQAIQKAQRNAGRRLARARRASNPIVVSWQPQTHRRCVICGKWIPLGGEAGHGWGFYQCESCFLARELRAEARRLSEQTETAEERAA